jgi:tetratricopeptide (TPR) repeat protein
MWRSRYRIGVVIAGWVAIVAAAGPAAAGQEDPAQSTPSAESVALRARGLRLVYSLDYDEARTAFQQAIAANPGDPAAYRQLAAVNWLNVLFRKGAVMVDDYVGEAKQQIKRAPPPADLDAQFHDAIGRALALAEQRLRERPQDPDAHYQLGAALGFVASYTATVEGRVLGGFRAARRAYEEHEQVLKLDSRRKDAGLVVGLYRYAVSSLPVHWRLLARLAGFGGGRDRGLRMVEEAAAYPADARPEALFTLVVMYSREERYDAALHVIERLQREYPRNRLLWLEAGTTALRAGRAQEARRQLEEGLSKLSTDSRPRAFGEEARWRLSYGTALAALRDAEHARRELGAVLAMPATDWVRGRAHKELGKLAAASGDRARAAEEYRLAIRLCRAADDTVCSDEVKQLLASIERTGATGAIRP